MAASSSRERVSVMTLNLWNTEMLSKRTDALQQLVQRVQPDLLALQEVRPEVLELLDGELGETHERVRLGDSKDEAGAVSAFRGWAMEGNVYWRRDVFRVLAHEEHDLGMKEELRRMFTVRLEHRVTSRVVCVSSVHLTWEGHVDEVASGQSGRLAMTRKALGVLQAACGRGEQVVLCGDFNDRYHPRLIMQNLSGSEDAQFVDTMTALGVPVKTTWPTPSWNWVEDAHAVGPDHACDFIFVQRGTRVVASQRVDFSVKGVFPSDHYPVLAVLEVAPLQSG